MCADLSIVKNSRYAGLILTKDLLLKWNFKTCIFNIITNNLEQKAAQLKKQPHAAQQLRDHADKNAQA